ncbi:MAG: hypothetical protein B6I28_01655 [Fusobacteriia bacterium 4572_132]|nr:MAG: hypothetical protein B6I28_01655 [Fusobacteriia bacterium 4572_132]
MKLAIMADDFTGANDIGVNFIKYGLNVVTLVENKKIDCDVKIISSESRNLKEKESYEKVKKLFCELKKSGFDKFYKKIDSTLRGNVKKEIEAILENTDEIVSVVVGFPKMQRKIINGRHKPIVEDDLKKILPNSELITIKDIRGDFQKRLKNIKSKLLIFDSETEADLKKIAKELVKLKLDKFIVGSAGIMQYLPEEWGIKKGKVLIISGSCSNTNIKQIEEFIKTSNEEIDVFNLDILKQDEKILELVSKSKKDILIRTLEKKKEMDFILNEYKKKGIEKIEATKLVVNYVAEITQKIIRMKNIRNLLISGGETTYRIIKKLKIKGLKIEEEIETGIAKTRSLDLKYSIITKPGGFGGKKIYKKAYENLKNDENRGK